MFRLLFKLFLFILYFYFLAVLGLHCCMGSSLVATSGGFSLVVVYRLLIAVASLVVERGLWGVRASFVAHGLSSCSSWSLEHKLN